MIVCSPMEVIPLIKKYTNRRQENFGVICLDDEKKVICYKILFKGTSNLCLVDTKMVFWYAFQKKASAILVFHNHPSQNTNPSDEDNKLTDKLNEACNVVGMTLFDHIIIGKYDYYSFLEHDNVLSVNKNLKVAEV